MKNKIISIIAAIAIAVNIAPKTAFSPESNADSPNVSDYAESDAAALQAIIAEQIAGGATVSDDLGDSAYTWNSDGRITQIEWYKCNLNGNLDLTGLDALEFLDFGSCSLVSLDVSGCTSLKELRCDNNQLTALDVTKNTALKALECHKNQLTSLDIAKNTDLAQLNCGNNRLTAFDVTKNTALKELWCDNNQLVALDVTKNTALKALECHKNQLTSLDITKNTDLTRLNCGNNRLTALDVTKNTALDEIDCQSNQLTYIDLTELNNLFDFNGSDQSAAVSLIGTNGSYTTNKVTFGRGLVTLGSSAVSYTSGVLKSTNDTVMTSTFDILLMGNGTHKLNGTLNLSCTDIGGKNRGDAEIILTVIDAQNAGGAAVPTDINDSDYVWSVNGRLTEIHWYNKKLNGSLDLAGLDALELIFFLSNELTALDVSGCPALKTLYCTLNRLTVLDVTKNTALEALWCAGNQLTSLDVTKNSALKELNCGNRQLTVLDVTKNTALTSLSCSGTQLAALDVTKNTALTSLDCDINQQLTTLDVTKNTALNTLNCRNSNLTSLDVSGCTALKSLICENNQLTAIDITKNTALSVLYCDGNQLSSLDVTKNTALTSIHCSRNQLTYFDVTKNTTLNTLECYRNNLTELDVTKNTALKRFCFNENLLTELDVTKNTSLTTLECHKNQLTNLDITKNTALESLKCNDNQLSFLDLTGLNKLSTFVGGSQSVSASLTKTDGKHTTDKLTFGEGTTFGETALSYAGGVLTSSDTTVTSSDFTSPTGLAGCNLTGTLKLTPSHLYINAVNISGTSWVEIYNPTDKAVSTRGLYLSNDSVLFKWKLPSFIVSIAPRETVRFAVYDESVEYTKLMIVGMSLSLGETVSLHDAAGNVLSLFKIEYVL